MSLIIDPYRFAAASDTFIMGYRQDVMDWSSWDASGGSWSGGPSRTQDSGFLGGGYVTATKASTGGYISWNVNLEAGTYTLTHIFTGSANGGIVTFDLDGTSLGTIDTYDGAFPKNKVGTISGFTVSAAGNYVLTGTVTSKHASAAAYNWYNASITLTRTGA